MYMARRAAAARTTVLAVLTARGDLHLLTRTPDLRQAQYTSTLGTDEIHIWQDIEGSSPARDLANLLSDLGVHGPIGYESDTVGLTDRTGRALHTAIPGLIDASAPTVHSTSLRAALDLAGQGHEVTALRRSDVAVPPGLRRVQADVTDRLALARVTLPDAEVLLFCVAAGRADDATYRALYIDGLTNVLDALRSRTVLPARWPMPTRSPRRSTRSAPSSHPTRPGAAPDDDHLRRIRRRLPVRPGSADPRRAHRGAVDVDQLAGTHQVGDTPRAAVGKPRDDVQTDMPRDHDVVLSGHGKPLGAARQGAACEIGCAF